VIYRTPFFLPLIYPELFWRIPTTKKEVYLTFDDGPIPGPTEFVIQELANAKAQATFFCIGDNVVKHHDIFNKVVEAGHAIGNHTFNHLKGWSHSVPDYMENVRQCQEVINPPGNAGDILSNRNLFRPPYGRIKKSQIDALWDFRIVMWDVLTHDYSSTISPSQCLRGTQRAIRPGSIVVFHDSLKSEKNLTFVLPKILAYLISEGYSFKTL
jgi:peptidoglycan-N-acetylglucosamine deacetylase